MKTIKSVILASLVLLFATAAGFAQTGIQSDSTSKTGIDNFGNNASLLKYKRLGFSMEMGVGVTGSKYGVGSYTYLSPFLSYKVSPKFRLDVGASYIQGFNNTGINEYFFGKNPSYLSLFARGNYLVNDKLLISGAVYKTFDLNQPQTTELTTNKRTFDNYGVMLGAEYKITENLTIGAQVNFSDRNSNYFPGSDYYQNDFGSGFHQGMNQNNAFGGNRPYSCFGTW